MIKLTYIYHSCYVIESEAADVIIDYWKDTQGETEGWVHEQLLKRKKPLYVLASHIHPDHYNPEILKWKEIRPNVKLILSKDILKKHKNLEEAAVWLKHDEEWDNDNIRVEAWPSTDVGISWAIKIAGKKIFHAGDFGNWKWSDEMSESVAKGAEHDYLQKLAEIQKAHPQFDVALLPTDPRKGTSMGRGALQFIQAIKCRYIAGMHYELVPNGAQFVQKLDELRQVPGTEFLTAEACGKSWEIE